MRRRGPPSDRQILALLEVGDGGPGLAPHLAVGATASKSSRANSCWISSISAAVTRGSGAGANATGSSAGAACAAVRSASSSATEGHRVTGRSWLCWKAAMAKLGSCAPTDQLRYPHIGSASPAVALDLLDLGGSDRLVPARPLLASLVYDRYGPSSPPCWVGRL